MSDYVTADLVAIRRRVLAHLEHQQAQMGIYTPPYIQIEIEKNKQAIERILHYSYIFTLQREVLESERPKLMPGAILLISREEIVSSQIRLTQASFDAIAYHRAALKHCWLIGTTGDQGSIDAATWLADYCRVIGINADVWPVDDPSSVEETFTTVQLLYAGMQNDSGLQPHEVVADITGATKPMSIGMLRACQGRSAVQYMIRQQNDRSLPIILSSVEPPDAPAPPEMSK